MKLKTKLCSTIVMFCLTIVTLMVGVWAVKSANVNIGGTLSFVAQGIEATISKGTMSNGTWQTASHATTKLKQIEITKADTTSTLSSKFSSWSGINLNFNENGDDITISFSITNNSDTNSIAVDVSTSYASATNCTIAIDTSSASIEPNKTQNFTLTMKITDKDINASMTNFTVIFNMQLVQPAPPVDAEDVSYLTFSYDDTTMTASVTDCDTSIAEAIIPERVLYSDAVYETVSIGIQAFYKCTGLTSITIPDSVTSIGNNAFLDCTGLTSISVDSENSVYDSRNNCNAIIETATNTLIQGCKNSTIPDSVTSIGESAFNDCTGLTSITIPNSVTSIGDYAFTRCTGLTSITIPDSVTSIGNNAFLFCAGLASVTIGNGVTSMGNAAFQECSQLTSITIPNSVISIGINAFSGCTGLTSISVDSGNSVYDSRNNCNAIIETSTNTLIKGSNNSTIPNTVTSIGDSAFDGCTGLTSITIPDSVTSIGESAFRDCTGLTSITIPDSVTSIGGYAFSGCTGLTNVTIGSGVTSIGGYAFSGCTNLAEVNVKATSVPNGGNNMFYNCSSSLVIYVPTASVSAYKAATYWKNYSRKIQGKSF
ncbi:MAG: leucine-rich repeat domain-containing protein [Clostridia bacterium]|nr:leucine-rich repeat domain-containing protein [Clostridia bacterium]